jgi:hypothetical protein
VRLAGVIIPYPFRVQNLRGNSTAKNLHTLPAR